MMRAGRMMGTDPYRTRTQMAISQLLVIDNSLSVWLICFPMMRRWRRVKTKMSIMALKKAKKNLKKGGRSKLSKRQKLR
jgi:hypothetical protein